MLLTHKSVATPRCRAAGAFFLAAAGALAGCGQKGPLFLPGASPAATTTPVDAPAPAPGAPADTASAPVRP